MGGDHATDSCAMHVVEDRVLFLGAGLYQRIHAPEARTGRSKGRVSLARRIAAYGAKIVIQGRHAEAFDGSGLAADLAALTGAADRVARLGSGALATACDEEDRETIEPLLAGCAYA